MAMLCAPLIKFNPVTGAEMGCRVLVDAPAGCVKSISSYNTVGIQYTSLGTQKNLQALDVNTNASAAQPIREPHRSITSASPHFCITRSGKQDGASEAGPDLPPRPSNLLKIHELKEGINFHSYSNVTGHRMVTFGAADAGSRPASSGNSRLLHPIALMPRSLFRRSIFVQGDE